MAWTMACADAPAVTRTCPYSVFFSNRENSKRAWRVPQSAPDGKVLLQPWDNMTKPMPEAGKRRARRTDEELEADFKDEAERKGGT